MVYLLSSRSIDFSQQIITPWLCMEQAYLQDCIGCCYRPWCHCRCWLQRWCNPRSIKVHPTRRLQTISQALWIEREETWNSKESVLEFCQWTWESSFWEPSPDTKVTKQTSRTNVIICYPAQFWCVVQEYLIRWCKIYLQMKTRRCSFTRQLGNSQHQYYLKFCREWWSNSIACWV